MLAALNGSPAADPLVLATALARHGEPPGSRDARIVVRLGEVPALGVLAAKAGRETDSWGDAMRRFFDEVPSRLRRLGYPDVHDHVTALAARLRDVLGAQGLAEARFVGIPRGGCIVLGMLAYTLGLSPEQLEFEPAASGLVVVVDDCAYSGARLGEYLADLDGAADVVVALLLAPAPLLEEIEEREDRVVACVVGDHMKDLTAAVEPEWTAGWSALLRPRPRYWVGVTEYVCLPWAEPDWMYWDETSRQAERGWPIMPPEDCLEHRPDNGRTRLPVEIQQPGPGPLRAAVDVMHAGIHDAVVVTTLDGGRRFVLEDVAADIWRTIVEHGDVDRALEALLPRYDVAEEVLRADLAEFVGELTGAGLLREDRP